MCGQAAEKDAELLRYQQDDAALDELLAQEATEEEEEAAAAEDAEPPTKRCICLQVCQALWGPAEDIRGAEGA